MLNLDEAGIRRYARIWGAILIALGIVEFGFFMLATLSGARPPFYPATIPYIVAGLVAWFYPTTIAFLYYAFVLGLNGLAIAFAQRSFGILPILYILFAALLGFIYWQLNQQETAEPDEKFLDLAPKVAIGAGILGLVLSPLAILASNAPILAAPGVQFGVLALAAGAVSIFSTDKQFPLSAGGVLLGAVALIIWAAVGLF